MDKKIIDINEKKKINTEKEQEEMNGVFHDFFRSVIRLSREYMDRLKEFENSELKDVMIKNVDVFHQAALEKSVSLMKIKENSMVNQYGFVVHCVVGEDGKPFYHTHGLGESYNHKELEIIVPIPQRQAQHIIHNIVGNIKEGAKFEDKDLLSDIIEDYDIMLRETKEGLLRIILPSKDGAFSFKQEDPLGKQLEDLK